MTTNVLQPDVVRSECYTSLMSRYVSPQRNEDNSRTNKNHENDEDYDDYVYGDDSDSD